MRAGDAGGAKPIDVWFVLPPDLVLLDFAGPAEAFRIAAMRGGAFRVHVAAAEAAATTSLGVTLGRIESLPDALRAEDLLIVCGSTNGEAALASKPGRALVRWLRDVGGTPRRFACVCAGALFA
ncbi:MAG TPA: thiamine biosynthesis protein ThiJ, partial [Rudaea sp.]